MAVFTIFFQMLALLLMIGAGYLMAKKKMVDEHTNGQISRMIINVFNPLLFLSSAFESVGTISMSTMLQIGLVAAGMFVFFIAAGMLLTPFFDKDQDQRKIFQMMFVFSNLGFIGIPVINSILGAEYVVYVTGFLVVYNIVFYTYGLSVMNGRFSAALLRTMVNPGSICCVIAVAVFCMGVQVPEFINTAVMYLGNAASPLALVLVGYTLERSEFKKIFGEMRLYLFSAVKLLVIPVAGMLLIRQFVDDDVIRGVCMVVLATPVGSMTAMLAQQYDGDYEMASKGVALTTILSVATMPIVSMIVG